MIVLQLSADVVDQKHDPAALVTNSLASGEVTRDSLLISVYGEEVRIGSRPTRLLDGRPCAVNYETYGFNVVPGAVPPVSIWIAGRRTLREACAAASFAHGRVMRKTWNSGPVAGGAEPLMGVGGATADMGKLSVPP